ncbi:uncharacterized protein PG986_010417 [Apiospora aurea]|uniref:Uncharacterized protein n=1 Tax=Apiospora aurea TaxID=335848 RepID=A0ABR1Q265_9PEZI
MPIALLVPELAVAIVDGATSVGGLAAWCGYHKDDPGCVHHNERDDTIIGTSGAPSLMGVFRRQQDVGPCGVPQYNFDQCHDQLRGLTVQTSIPGESEGQFDNVPAACMDLAAVLSGDCTDTTISPTVCGSACLHYSGLTDGHYANISIALTS